MGRHYLYRHIRLDINEPFYIGIGTKLEKFSKTLRGEYSRAHTMAKRERSSFWHRIVNKTEYEVEIFLESDDYEFIKQKEIEFIALYGRRDLGKGTLCNLTDGGEGMKGLVFTELHRSRISIASKGRVASDETKLKQSLLRKGKLWTDEQKEAFKPYVTWGEDHPSAKLILNLETGIFYPTLSEAAYFHNMKTSTLTNMLSGHRRNKTSLIYAESGTNTVYPHIPNNKPYINLSENNRGAKNSRSIKTINIETGELYMSIKEASESTRWNYQIFKEMVDSNSIRVNKTPFEYYNEEIHSHIIKINP